MFNLNVYLPNNLKICTNMHAMLFLELKKYKKRELKKNDLEIVT